MAEIGLKGMLYGIGAGPGDPELITVKAVNIIRNCGVIAVPKTGDSEGEAQAIVKKYAEDKELLICRFVMEPDMAKRRAARMIAADEICGLLTKGIDVGFVTIGDPATYSTYMYIHKIITGRGYAAEIIPGVTSYSAAAAAFGIALCEDGEALTVIPARHGDAVDALIDGPGNKVIMKSGGNLENVLKKLKERGLGENVKVAFRVTMEGQRLFHSADEYLQSPEPGYFTVALIKSEEI